MLRLTRDFFCQSMGDIGSIHGESDIPTSAWNILDPPSAGDDGSLIAVLITKKKCTSAQHCTANSSKTPK
jgi:hypothetical protein